MQTCFAPGNNRFNIIIEIDPFKMYKRIDWRQKPIWCVSSNSLKANYNKEIVLSLDNHSNDPIVLVFIQPNCSSYKLSKLGAQRKSILNEK